MGRPGRDDCWLVLGTVSYFRWLPAGVPYGPGSPWSSPSRFNDGSLLTLYLASTADGAVSEFLRRHPEFLVNEARVLRQNFEMRLDNLSAALTVEAFGGDRAAITKAILPPLNDEQQAAFDYIKAEGPKIGVEVAAHVSKTTGRIVSDESIRQWCKRGGRYHRRGVRNAGGYYVEEL